MPSNLLRRSRPNLPFAIIPLALAGLLAQSAPAAAQALSGITALGTLGGSSAWAFGISADGTVVVGQSQVANGNYHAFRWTATGGMVDIDTVGSNESWASGVSADGSVIAGSAYRNNISGFLAYRWTAASGMVDLGTLGGTQAFAYGISADGTTVVGTSTVDNNYTHAFRWTTDGMTDLGTFGGYQSWATAASANGSVVVGQAANASSHMHAFRWTATGGMSDLGTLGGAESGASSVSSDGNVVVGHSKRSDGYNHAFRWTQAGSMVDLGTLGGAESYAYAVSGNGAVVVGAAQTASTVLRAFRWTQAGGMQSIEDWLRANGVNVPTDITSTATATNQDGSIVVGHLQNNNNNNIPFIARIAPTGNGLITVADLQQSLSAGALGGTAAMTAVQTALNGAHGRPLSRRVGTGQDTFWVAGDWGTDEHGARSGNLGLAEFGVGRNFGPVQANVATGYFHARQALPLDGRAQSEGAFVHAEAILPVAGSLWATLGGYGAWGEATLQRAYLNAGTRDISHAAPKTTTWSVRARLDWENAAELAAVHFTPYADLGYTQARMDSYTETGGGFPAYFDARTEKATELRLGINTARQLFANISLTGTLEAIHRFETSGPRSSGQVIGLGNFSLPGRDYRQDWMRAGIGIEGKIAGGIGSLMLNGTTQGESMQTWLAANWQMAF